MARKRRPAAAAAAATPTPARVGPWIWYLLVFSLGLAIAAELGFIAATDMKAQRDNTLDICRQLEERGTFEAGQQPLPCPKSSDDWLALSSIPLYVGLAGVAFSLSQVVARRLAVWMYRRRTGGTRPAPGRRR